jgi:hypothetical protein
MSDTNSLSSATYTGSARSLSAARRALAEMDKKIQVQATEAASSRSPARGPARQPVKPATEASAAPPKPSAQDWVGMGEPADVLLQHLQKQRPVFVALHDLHGGSSVRLLKGLSSRYNKAIELQVLRCATSGAILAQIEYLELHLNEVPAVRIYACEIDTSAAQQRLMARHLLAFSAMSVMMVGDRAGQHLASSLEAWRQQMCSEPWHNRHMVLMPLSASGATVTRNAQLGRATPVAVRVTPAVLSVEEAWRFISGAWRRVVAGMNGADSHFMDSGYLVSDRQEAENTGSNAAPVLGSMGLPPSNALPLFSFSSYGEEALNSGFSPMTKPAAQPDPAPQPEATPAAESLSHPQESVPGFASSSSEAADGWAFPGVSMGVTRVFAQPRLARPAEPVKVWAESHAHARSLLEVDGVIACAVFDVNSGLATAQVGSSRVADQLSKQGLVLYSTAAHSARLLGSKEFVPQMDMALEDHVLMLRPMPKHPQLAVIVMADRSRCNLQLLQLTWMKLDALMGSAGMRQAHA